jgi:hypothetical protein
MIGHRYNVGKAEQAHTQGSQAYSVMCHWGECEVLLGVSPG